MRYQSVIFDLDGTLTDSGEGIMNSAEYAFEQLGIAVPDRQDLRKIVGPPLTYSFPLFGVPEDQVVEAIRLYRDQYNNRGGKYQNHVYPGIEEMLSQLKQAGCRLFVATSKPEPLAREILEALREWFEVDESREKYIADCAEWIFFATKEAGKYASSMSACCVRPNPARIRGKAAELPATGHCGYILPLHGSAPRNNLYFCW